MPNGSLSFRFLAKLSRCCSCRITCHKIWGHTHSGRPVAKLSGHFSRVTAVAFSPDGSRIATGSFDRNVRLWRKAAPQDDPVLLPGHSDQLVSLAFSPNGHYLASGARNGAILLHHLNLETLVAATQAAVPRRLTDDEVAKYLPGSGLD
jgi:WD40 repeat protein